MTRAEDVIHELTGLHTSIAKALDDTPTGVTPGYSAALGGTVMPNGKLRYVRSGGAISGINIWEDDVTGTSVPTTTNTAVLWSPTNSSYLANYYDTDTYWAAGHPTRFVFPATGYYDISVMLGWEPNATGSRQLFLNQLDAGGGSDALIGMSSVIGFSSFGGPYQVATTLGWHTTAGYMLEVVGRQNSGSTLQTTGISYVSIVRRA